MRVLLVNRYFWPDVPHYGQMLKQMADRFVADGHRVTVLTTQTSYNDILEEPLPASEKVDGIEIRRIRLFRETKSNYPVRALNVILYLVAIFGYVIRHARRFDLFTVATTPPVAMGLAAQMLQSITRRPFLYHCQDVHPEIDVFSGLMKPGMLYRTLRRIDTATCGRALRVVVLSRDMQRTIEARGVEISHVHILNNFDISDRAPDANPELPAELRKPPGSFQVLFAGNMGLYQGLKHVVDAAAHLSHLDGLRIVFMGSGVNVQDLKARAGDQVGRSVWFLPHQPMDRALAVMEESDLAIVSLHARVLEAAYPSKVTAYMKAGCRLLVIADHGSELARMVLDEQIGHVCAPGSPQRIADIIEDEHATRPEINRAHIKAIGNRLFGREQLLDRWSQLLGEIEQRRYD